MKKKIAIILAVMLCLGAVMTACKKRVAPKVSDVPSSVYAVIGNGGMSVQQGEYVYFINGYADSADDSGDTNRDDSVIRGGIYRAKLADVGDAPIETVTSTVDPSEYSDPAKFQDPYMGYYGTYTTVNPADASPVQNSDADDVSGFAMEVVEDYEGDEIAQIKVEPIVNKKVTTGGDAKGGLFIFDGWIYYTTPVNRRSSDGAVQYMLVDFMRARLDGSDVQTVYTSNSASVQPSYGYYKYGGTTYLVVYDSASSSGTTLDTLYYVACGSKKPEDPKLLMEDVASAIFPKKPVYYAGMSENSIEDFVYFTRAPKQEDPVSAGNIVCRVRPNGAQGREFMSNDSTVTLLDVKNGFLFYTEADNYGSTYLRASDLAGVPFGDNAEDGDLAQTSTRYTLHNAAGNLTNIYVNAEIVACSALDQENGIDRKVSAEPYAIATLNSSIVKATDATKTPTVLVSGQSGVVQTMYNNNEFLYMTTTDSAAPVFKANIVDENQSPMQVTAQNAVVQNFFPVDVSAGYLFYVSDSVVIVTDSTVTQDEDEEDDATQEPDEEKTYVTLSNYVLVRKLTNVATEPEWLAAGIDRADVPEPTDPDDDTSDEDSSAS